MTEVRTKGNCEQWIRFFRQAVMKSAEDEVDAGIPVQTSGTSRNRTFAYEAYLNILRRGT